MSDPKKVKIKDKDRQRVMQFANSNFTNPTSDKGPIFKTIISEKPVKLDNEIVRECIILELNYEVHEQFAQDVQLIYSKGYASQ